MPRLIKIQFVVFLLLLLQACAQKQLRVSEISTDSTGVVVQSLVMNSTKNSKKQSVIVCYSELDDNRITGISCQNDTGLPLFSGGLVDGEFQLEKVSRFIFNIKPQTILNYLKISLFSEYQLESQSNYSIEVSKNNGGTLIQDFETKLKVEINRL